MTTKTKINLSKK